MSAAGDVLAHARRAGLRIAVAESCTGGMLAAALTDLPGSSDVLDRGFVTYSNRAKEEMLGVRGETLEAFGAVSEEVAREMTEGALVPGVDLSVAITGIAGPGGSDHKPEGRVCFALARRGGATVTETVEFGAPGRGAVRRAAVDHALVLILRGIKAQFPRP